MPHSQTATVRVAGETAHTGGSDPAVTMICPSRSLFNLDIAALWQYRELLGFLIWRDVKIRYKQTMIGALWVVLQPLLTMAILTLVFGRFAKIPSDGLPYALFAFVGLLPWMYVSQAVIGGGSSLIRNSKLISKVYFPRLTIPLGAVATPLVDLALSFAALLGLMAWFGVTPTWRLLALPAYLLFAVITALAASLCFSALNVRYRDVGYAIPFVIQIWMYASPVAYPVALVPERWRMLYGLNPMASIIQGFRWSLIGGESPEIRAMAISIGMVAVWLALAVIYFRHMERTFADIV